MKLAIFGTRTVSFIRAYRLVVREVFQNDAFRHSLFNDNLVIGSGASGGVDIAAERFGEDAGLNVVLFRADWARFGKAAGPERNGRLATWADRGLALWDHRSRGTRDTIDKLEALGKQVSVIKVQ